ncbi:hypothetical protein BOTBODRAFT_113621 [Botryobasidium botryosum FD-172 SS1]|uniref:Mitochondrial import inner membrane translocase subunit TIM50 n=1 Tax=Botryobasidium botryosum (strain FD-172 SS1) TaxID=930990 RepID=A0A067MBF1_BOTB1|nr:hypothetical protein BOTBODRAFT_113621 [Botryobasidium botryosum FD-172 SS1]
MAALRLARLARTAPRPAVRFLSTPPTQPPASSTPPPPPAQNVSSLPSLDFAPPDAEPQRTGAKSAKDSLSSIERKRRVYSRAALALMGLGLGAGWLYMGREWEADEAKPKLEDTSTRVSRANARISEMLDYFNKPAWKELLPPPLPPTHQRPYTLLISIDDLLVTSVWDRQHGWRTAKRPGVDYFLAYLSQFYEIVVFTTQPSYTAIPILEKLDPFSWYISYKLFREATRSYNGQIVKDLKYLNRDLSKVIALDTSAEHLQLNPDSAVVIPRWKGDPSDRGLIGLIPFLESIGIHQPPDVRPILKAYEGKNIPLEYAKKEAEIKAKHIAEWEKEKKGKGGAVTGFTLSGLFGGPARPTSHTGPPPTYLEQKREEAQQLYRQEQEYLKANEAEFKRLRDEDIERQMKEMKGSLWGFLNGQMVLPPAEGEDAKKPSSS